MAYAKPEPYTAEPWLGGYKITGAGNWFHVDTAREAEAYLIRMNAAYHAGEKAERERWLTHSGPIV